VLRPAPRSVPHSAAMTGRMPVLGVGGGAVGAAVGAYMDHQQKEMEQSLQAPASRCKERREYTESEHAQQHYVCFRFSKLDATGPNRADSVANILNQYPESTITITGHTMI